MINNKRFDIVQYIHIDYSQKCNVNCYGQLFDILTFILSAICSLLHLYLLCIKIFDLDIKCLAFLSINRV